MRSKCYNSVKAALIYIFFPRAILVAFLWSSLFFFPDHFTLTARLGEVHIATASEHFCILALDASLPASQQNKIKIFV